MVGGSVALLCLLGAAFYVLSSGSQAWRLEVVSYKARGQFVDVTWSEVFRIIRPGSGFWITTLDEKANPNDAIQNPFTSDEDLKRGAEFFRAECSACHGADANGTGVGPALAGKVLLRASSDWMTYRVIADGIEGTSMAPHKLPWRETWQLAAFVRSVKLLAAPPSDLLPHAVNVQAADFAERSRKPDDWLTYSGSLDGQRYSGLQQINVGNVSRLQVRWLKQIRNNVERQATVPLVSGGIMYYTVSPATVMAVNAATGKVYWRYDNPVPDDVTPCCGVVNRGAALLGNRVIIGTIDAQLIALDANTGQLVWKQTVANYHDGYAITGAPLAFNDLVVTGVAGGDFATRGFLAAYRAATGEPVWRFEAIPGPGEPGHDSWSGDSWKTGGSATWMTGSFDAATNSLYWGIGNPAPVWNGNSRLGDNLYSNSVVALDPATGKLRWHFQFTPHNVHDWDSAQVPVLLDAPGGTPERRMLAWPNRNGFFYSIDASNGRFVQGRAFAQQTWAEGLDKSGRPIVKPGTAPSLKGTIVWPGPVGATNWWPSAYSPALSLLYVPVLEAPAIYFSGGGTPVPEKQKLFLGSAIQSVQGLTFHTAVRALDPFTGELKWERRWPDRIDRNGFRQAAGGLLATAGGLVFGSDQGTVFALDAKTGAVLWTFETDTDIAAAPMTYAVDGQQYLAISSGSVMMVFALVK